MSPVRIRSPAPYFCPSDCHETRLVLLPFVLLLVALSALAQDYKLEPVATAAPGLPAAYAAAIQAQGVRVNGAGRLVRSLAGQILPVGAKPDDARFPSASPRALLGVIRFPGKGADRRGQVIPAGVYTLRYSNVPGGWRPFRGGSAARFRPADAARGRPGPRRQTRLRRPRQDERQSLRHPASRRLSLETPPRAPPPLRSSRKANTIGRSPSKQAT
jgi:hypothetical protein